MDFGNMEISKREFNKEICHFKSRHDLYFFLMNTLLQIKYDGWQYCSCDMLEKKKKNVNYVSYRLFFVILRAI